MTMIRKRESPKNQRIFMDGNEAIARGAIEAGCRYFFGYPITPQSEIAEYMSRELPRMGGVFVQSESETASIYMVYGGALAGARVMTSTSSPGFSLMQEGLSYIAEMEAPAVVVDVMRMGPGIGTGGQQGQTDYRQATKGGGHGAYRCLVLAPASPQECFDLMQVAFHLADKYRGPVIVLSDFIIGRMAEPVELRKLDLGPLPEKSWALKGKGQKKGKRSEFVSGPLAHGVTAFHQHQLQKYQKIAHAEVRSEKRLAEDASILLVAYGSSSRTALEAVKLGRAEGLKLGLFRPVSLWPFPQAELRKAATYVDKILVVEDSPGELVEDVEQAVRGLAPVHLLGVWARHLPGPSGLIYPERILEEVKKLA